MESVLSHASAVRLGELLADGEVSSVELTGQALARIEATQPTINAFRVVRASAALREAADADRLLRAGERAPLLGVPVAIKDDADIAGEPTAFGCPGPFPAATTDSTVVRRLRDAGAIIVGKTNTPEMGQWPFTEGSAFGATRNPWCPDRTPGGSSGGSAAAVAAGIVPVAVGSDGAGSIRIPAGWSNLVGIKPQRGRIPGVSDGVSVPGPLARTTEDAALLLDVLTGRPDTFRPAANREPGRLRIALSLRPPFTGYWSRLDPQIRTSVTDLAKILVELDHEVFPAEPRYGLVGLHFLARSAGGLYEWSAAVPDVELLDPRTRHNIATGRRFGRHLKVLTRPTGAVAERQVGRIFGRADVILTPTTAVVPPLVGQWLALSGGALNRTMVSACPYGWPWNALGWPGINVPAGFTVDGAPIGAQLLGPAGTESRLISLAGQLERRLRWQDSHPPTVTCHAG